ncbi:MAG: HIT family protein [Acidimicrobiales bacterium]
MRTDCLLCGIVAGEASARVITEDDLTLALVDPQQPRRGHCLVIPKTHVETVFELDATTGGAVMATVVKVALAVRVAFQPEGLSLWQSNGAAAGQEMPHFHIHILPRWVDDGLLRVYPTRPPTPPDSQLDEQLEEIRSALAALVITD